MNLPQFLPAAGSRIAVVGGCGGMGRALVAAALGSGMRVAVLDMERSLAKSPPPAEALALVCDVSEEASVQAAFDRLRTQWGALDALVDLAGYTGDEIRVRELPVSEWDAITGTCLRGMFLVTRAALPLLEAGSNPSIVLTASTFGHLVAHPGYAPYAASKAGVVSLGKALATECAPSIRVNVVSPGMFETPFLQGGLGQKERGPTALNVEKFPRVVPLRRLGQPSEIVGPILFLIGPAASYITGQVLHVNGGIWAP